jgi:hypothetical protein
MGPRTGLDAVEYRAVAQKRPRRGPQKTQFFYCCRRYLVTAAVYRVTVQQQVYTSQYCVIYLQVPDRPND